MLYRTNERNGEQISQLGFGCMRFPRKGARIDQDKTNALVEAAVAQGVNYFDTAYNYPGSEQALGTALARAGLRDKVKIASKMPIMLCKTAADFDRLFDTQLERLQTDRIDYYLMHMLCDIPTFERLKALGLLEWIQGKKAAGKIGQIGFSYHGGRDGFKRVLDAYDWEFVQIQYNYFDENTQAGRDGLQYAHKKGLPVFVMEPLRGGLLVKNLPATAKEVFQSASRDRTLAEWALRWLWNQTEVTMLLSGMNTAEQLEENLRLAETVTAANVSAEDETVYEKAIMAIKKSYRVPCTGCGYCLPCPQGVDIPTCFSCYNESYTGAYLWGVAHYMMTTGAISAQQNYASKCKKCGQCEKRCPQGIEIGRHMTDVSRQLESFWFRPVFGAVRKVLGIR